MLTEYNDCPIYAVRLRLEDFVKPRETGCSADKYLHVCTDGEMWVNILHIDPAKDTGGRDKCYGSRTTTGIRGPDKSFLFRVRPS